jgi:hypothetical protein
LHWYNLESGEKLPPDKNGIIRSHIFPGLWIDTVALLSGDLKAALETLSLGLHCSEHKTFVKNLANRMV